MSIQDMISSWGSFCIWGYRLLLIACWEMLTVQCRDARHADEQCNHDVARKMCGGPLLRKSVSLLGSWRLSIIAFMYLTVTIILQAMRTGHLLWSVVLGSRLSIAASKRDCADNARQQSKRRSNQSAAVYNTSAYYVCAMSFLKDGECKGCRRLVSVLRTMNLRCSILHTSTTES